MAGRFPRGKRGLKWEEGLELYGSEAVASPAGSVD